MPPTATFRCSLVLAIECCAAYDTLVRELGSERHWIALPITAVVLCAFALLEKNEPNEGGDWRTFGEGVTYI